MASDPRATATVTELEASVEQTESRDSATPVEPPAPEPEPVADPEAPVPPRESERPPSEEKPAAEKTKQERRTRFDGLPSILRRGLEKGIEAGIHTIERSLETGRETTDAVRERLNEVKVPRDVAGAVREKLSEAKLPRELASAVLSQLDETKNDVLRILAREFREFLEATDLATELKNALTSLSFEVKTEIRFIPNDAGSGVKADVRARSRIKRSPASAARRRRTRGS
jgi:hypothetical protein